MTTSKLIRWSGAAAILSGLANIVMSLISPGESSALIWGYVVGGMATMFALIGIYSFQVEESGVMGFVGFILAMIGNVFLATPSSYEGNFMLGGSIYALGLILFAIGIWKAGNFPRWVPALWILALLLGVPGFLIEGLSGIFVILAGVAFSAGFIAAGYVLWTQSE